MKYLAKFISVVFHPLWMPLVIYLHFKWIVPFRVVNSFADLLLILLLVINTVAPAISFFLMLRFRMITTLELHDRRERLAPYAVVVFYYLGAWGLLIWRLPGLPGFILNMFPAVALSLALAMLVNRRWKISVHMLAQGGWFGTLLAFSASTALPLQDWLLVSAACAILVGWSRVKLGAHDASQVYAGWLLGALVNFAVITWL